MIESDSESDELAVESRAGHRGRVRVRDVQDPRVLASVQTQHRGDLHPQTDRNSPENPDTHRKAR